MGSKQTKSQGMAATNESYDDQTQHLQSDPNMHPATHEQPIDLTYLPDDFPPRGLAEAIKDYDNQQLPFAIRYTNSTDRTKSVYLTQDGERPEYLTQATLYTWALNDHEELWTLDLNGDRIIVKSSRNAGAVLGAKWKYHAWSPVLNDFEEKPIAFSTIGNTRELKPSSTKGKHGKIHDSTFKDVTNATFRRTSGARFSFHETPIRYFSTVTGHSARTKQ